MKGERGWIRNENSGALLENFADNQVFDVIWQIGGRCKHPLYPQMLHKWDNADNILSFRPRGKIIEKTDKGDD